MYSASKFYFLSALSSGDYHDIKNFLEEKNDLHDVNNLNQTYLLQFLYTKKRLTITDIKIILLFLRYDSEVDRVDVYNETARKKLLKFGYSIEGKYLKISEELSKFNLIEHEDINMSTNVDDDYEMLDKNDNVILDEEMYNKDDEILK